MSWKKGDTISWFFAFSFMSEYHRAYFSDNGNKITKQFQADLMNKDYPKGKMIPR